MRFDRNGKLEFGGQGPQPMRAGAVWYRYTTGYCSVSFHGTVGVDKLVFGGESPLTMRHGRRAVILHPLGPSIISYHENRYFMIH